MRKQPATTGVKTDRCVCKSAMNVHNATLHERMAGPIRPWFMLIFCVLLVVTLPTTAQAQETLIGVSLSPRSYDADEFLSFLDLATSSGEIISWSGDWDLLAEPTSAPHVLMQLAPTYRFTPVVILQFFDQDTGQLFRPLNADTQTQYVDLARQFASTHQPAYLGLGIEVNLLHTQQPAAYEAFAGLFADTYEAVKAVSPQTQVFTVFQLERMNGLGGGLFGGVNDTDQAQWPLLGDFPAADMVAFTTYPSLVFPDPARIPDEYYTVIRQHTDKPVLFTELGWPAASTISGWESDEQEQVLFLERFRVLVDELSPTMVIWSFMYAQQSPPPFDTMTLRRDNGSPRPVWALWANA